MILSCVCQSCSENLNIKDQTIQKVFIHVDAFTWKQS